MTKDNNSNNILLLFAIWKFTQVYLLVKTVDCMPVKLYDCKRHIRKLEFTFKTFTVWGGVGGERPCEN